MAIFQGATAIIQVGDAGGWAQRVAVAEGESWEHGTILKMLPLWMWGVSERKESRKTVGNLQDGTEVN